MLTICPLCHHLSLPWQRTAMTSVGRVHLSCSPWTTRKVTPPLRTLFLRNAKLDFDYHREREILHSAEQAELDALAGSQ